MATESTITAATFTTDVAAIGSNIDKLRDENRRLKALLVQASLLVACQPMSHHRDKWLEEVEELTR